MRVISTAIVLTVLAALSASGEEIDVWEQADENVVRLKPSSFAVLPDRIREYLTDRGCRIPQTPFRSHPHNVASGELRGLGKDDWVVLCSIDRKSALLVFWGGSPDSISQIAPWSDDKAWLQTGSESVDYSRVISIADVEQIVSYSKSYNQTLPVNAEHDGVDEGFDGKASSVHYWHDGKWLQLQGAD